VVVGCLASLSPVKRHVDLLAAFGMLAPRCPQAQLLLIGEGPLRHDIEAQIHALGLAGRVRLMGLCANPQDVLPALDLAVLASSTEGLSNALLEAQACAIPVVVTAVGGNVDLVVPGRNGLLAPALAPQALAQALEQAVMDAAWRAQAGRAARAMVVARYSMEAMASAYDRLYRQLVQQRDANWAARAQPGPQSP
jgi:glycosyltransferase involved in cell wall biosynthesis